MYSRSPGRSSRMVKGAPVSETETLEEEFVKSYLSSDGGGATGKSCRWYRRSRLETLDVSGCPVGSRKDARTAFLALRGGRTMAMVLVGAYHPCGS